MKQLKKLLIVPDCHVPFHNKTAWKLMLKAGKALKPDIILIQGDFADFYSVSSHSKDPSRVDKLKEELRAVNKCLDELQALGAREVIFTEGNHEDRLRRYLQDKAPELFGLVDIPDLFKFEQRPGWKFVPYKQSVSIGKLNATHDVGTFGKMAVFQSLGTYQSNIVTGHTHRICYVVEGNAKGTSHVGASFGWLGDASAVDYMHQVSVARNWSLGFGTGYLEANGNVYLTPVVIVDNKCVLNGVLYKI